MLETVAAGDIDYGQYGIVRAVLWEYGQYCGSTGSTVGVRAVRVLVRAVPGEYGQYGC